MSVGFRFIVNFEFTLWGDLKLNFSVLYADGKAIVIYGTHPTQRATFRNRPLGEAIFHANASIARQL